MITIVNYVQLARGRIGYSGIFICVLGLIVGFVHTWQLGQIPRGLYLDESSIGLNAATIAESGRDEYGVAWPVYFNAFGEYKNPLFIYTTALIFKLFGVSIEALRATSALYFALFLLAAVLLVRDLFPRNRAVLAYAMAAAGTLPWFFTISRIAFEVISQVAIVTWAFFALRLTYQEQVETGRGKAAVAGGLLGLSMYSYSTARLLTPMFVGVVLLIWPERHYWRRHAALLGALALAGLPILLFSIAEPGALTRRFGEISYFSKDITVFEMAARFWNGYLSYFSPRFLLLQGQAAASGGLRHHTGFGGEIQAATLALAAVGALVAIRSWGAIRDRFSTLLLVGLAIAPIGGALTSTAPHALRGVLLGLFLFLISVYGLAALTRVKQPLARGIALGAVALALAAQSVGYVSDYFGLYAERSITAFGSFGLEQRMRLAHDQSPGEIVGYGEPEFGAHVAFYDRLLDHASIIPVRVGSLTMVNRPCVVWSRKKGKRPDLGPLEDRPRTFVWDVGLPVGVDCFSEVGVVGPVADEPSGDSVSNGSPPELDPPAPTPDPVLYARLPGEDLAAFERRLRTLAARDLLPSGPGGRFILEAIERERATEPTSTGSSP